MTFDVSKFPMIVRDNYFGVIESEVPRVYVDNFIDLGCCLRMDSQGEFKKGFHLVVELTHSLGVINIKNRDEGYIYFHKIKHSINFFSSIINKLELSEETMYVRSVLAYVIGYEEKTLLRLQDKMDEMKKANNGV